VDVAEADVTDVNYLVFPAGALTPGGYYQFQLSAM
jgi:hypothetical protein